MRKPRRVAELLQRSNIRPTYPRIKVLEYLTEKMTHPTVEEIYNSLVKEIPTLSKTTVYNTLKVFVEAGLAKIVTIEENEMRYDVIMHSHGHFKCECCAKIYDFALDIEAIQAKELNQFKVREKNVLFYGLCPQCIVDEPKER
jgi:Fe2+ or Zn2+ uptake regulation protein